MKTWGAIESSFIGRPQLCFGGPKLPKKLRWGSPFPAHPTHVSRTAAGAIIVPEGARASRGNLAFQRGAFRLGSIGGAPLSPLSSPFPKGCLDSLRCACMHAPRAPPGKRQRASSSEPGAAERGGFHAELMRADRANTTNKFTIEILQRSSGQRARSV